MGNATSLPPLGAHAAPEEFARLFHAAFGGEEAVVNAAVRNKWNEVVSRLQPYAYGFPGGASSVASYTAPEVTPDRILRALACPSGPEAIRLRADAAKYCVAGRLLNWVQNNSDEAHAEVSRWLSGEHELLQMLDCHTLKTALR